MFKSEKFSGFLFHPKKSKENTFIYVCRGNFIKILKKILKAFQKKYSKITEFIQALAFALALDG